MRVYIRYLVVTIPFTCRRYGSMPWDYIYTYIYNNTHVDIPKQKIITFNDFAVQYMHVV